MKIDHIDILKYALPFVKPFVTSQGAITERRGLIIRGVAENGLSGYGEIAPLAGFSSESLTDCLEPLKSIVRTLNGLAVPNSPMAIAELMRSFGHIPAPVAFGAELMLSDLAAQVAGKQLAHWLRPDAGNSVAINAVLAGGDIESQVRSKLANGYDTFKLKVGAAPLAEDLKRIGTVRALIGAQSKLRLDANRAYDFVSAIRTLAELREFDVEYIEEPLRAPSVDDFSRLRSKANVPIAVDETMNEWCSSVASDNVALSQDQLAAFDVAVCKPALSGGIFRTLKLAELLKSHGKKVIVTSSLDSGIGVAAALQVACALKIEAACGLDTGGIFQPQLIKTTLAPQRGRMELPNRSGLGVSLDLPDCAPEVLRKIDVN